MARKKTPIKLNIIQLHVYLINLMNKNSSKSMILGLFKEKIVSVCVLVVIDNKLSQIQKDISKDIRIL
jgi:hypothetical protein